MDEIRHWLENTVGIGPLIQDVFLFPFLVALLLWMAASAVLAVVFLKVKSPEQRERIRRIAVFVAIGFGLAVFWRIWHAGVRQIAAIFSDRTPEEVERIQGIVNGVVYTVVATGAAALWFQFLRKALAIVTRRVEAWASVGTPLRFRGLDLVGRDRVRDTVLVVTRAIRILLIAVLIFVYITLVLSFFPVTAPYGDEVIQYLLTPVTDLGQAVIGYLPNLLYLVVLLVAARFFLKGLRFLFDAVGRGALVIGNFDSDWASPTYKLTRILVVVFTLMVAYPYLPGAESEFFRGFSLALGALLTLGSTAAVGNVVSGVILTYTRAFRIGDRVKIGDSVGDVLAKSLFVTRLRTIKNEEVTIPNGVVLGGQTINFSNAAKRSELALTVEVGIGYDVHWRKVQDLLKTAALQTPGIVAEPAPFVWPKALGDFAVVHELHAYTDRADLMGGTYAGLRRSVLDVLHEAGVEIMTPDVAAVRDGSLPSIPGEHGPSDGDGVRGIRLDVADQASSGQS